ncbi:hypothetical protein PI125_g20711 [Phytophthora idaei]|nr:hypothetical protein PI125_g20711 [Phytophthora idaei]
MTNFAPVELERLWGYLRAHVSENWNVGRGRKREIRPKDVPFMFLASLKHCGQWDIVAGVFKIKSANIQKVVLAFAKVVSLFLYEKAVLSVADKLTMESLVLSGHTFRNCPCALRHRCKISTNKYAQRENEGA